MNMEDEIRELMKKIEQDHGTAELLKVVLNAVIEIILDRGLSSEERLFEAVSNEIDRFKYTCKNCGEELRSIFDDPDIPVHVHSGLRTCDNGKTLAEYNL